MNLVFWALLVGAVGYGVSVTLYIKSAQGFGASRSQMVFSSAPFFGVLLSVTVLKEPFTGSQGLAAMIILASLGLLFSEKHAHTHLHDWISHRHDHWHSDDHHGHEHQGRSAAEGHEHWHQHEPVQHDHPHWPDLHHRHRHPGDEESGMANKVDADQDK
jgi:hypothetical protein